MTMIENKTNEEN